MSTMIVDYGMSNLGSIRRAVEECGADVFVSGSPSDIETAEHVILPGVGAFPDGMRNLREAGFESALKKAVSDGVPLLGICLGMQLLSTRGYEEGVCEGLNLIPGEVRLLVSRNGEDRVPHVGWNDLRKVRDSPILENVPGGSDFYFVHSYHLVPEHSGDVLAETDYCGGFACVFGRGNVFGTQFHPEKSGGMGFRILRNFLNYHSR
ncbi:MAG: imidazole glycerol phosphate synthase subunit HisH [Synergistaceae bacterium]|jgi:glutamine amidotransferase|nr:imidazole glycerol phosphate synthase subunit HisH [Synergistaceae bacterium]